MIGKLGFEEQEFVSRKKKAAVVPKSATHRKQHKRVNMHKSELNSNSAETLHECVQSRF
jgi:hypothetical protein